MPKPELNLVKADKEQRAAFNGDGQRVIRHDPGKLPEILDECEQALVEIDCNLFVQSGRLVPGEGRFVFWRQSTARRDHAAPR